MLNFTKGFQFHRVPILIIILISFYLVVIWLPKGAIIAGGDVGIPNLLPREQLKDVSSSWWDRHATGLSSPTTYTSIPYYVILSLFESIGMSSDITQKGVFFAIIAGGAISIYFLGLNFSFPRKTTFLASLFYIFNLTSLSVWHRGVHNAMLMLLLAPLSLLILAWGIKNRKYSSILLINIVSFLLSYVFGALGYVFSLWLLWTIFVLIVLFDQWHDKSARKFILSYYLILVISWIGINAWWIVNLIFSGNYALGQFTPEELKAKGSDVLMELKPYHQPQYILRALSAFSHYGAKDWGDSYFNPFLILLSWIPTVIVFSTTLIKTNYKLISWKFLIILAIVILTLSKGVNPPLGLLNALPYDLFLFLAPLRNPYEKIGILLAIPFSLLFAQGLYQITDFFKSKKMHYLSLLSILAGILCLTILVWPLWLGRLFVSEGRKYAVSIPSYYKEANDWLKERVLAEDTRVLHLPLSWGESIDYNWGYTGIEPSQYFFNGSSIGYQIGISSVDSRIRDLLISVHNQETANIQKAFSSLNVGWVVIHNEISYRDRILEPPDKINKWLISEPFFLEHAIDFGPLSIWKVKDQYRLGHFYSEGKLVSINKVNSTSSLKVWDDIEKPNDGFLTEMLIHQGEVLDKFIAKNVVFPKGKMEYLPFGLPNAEAALDGLAIVNEFPDSPFYSLTTFKESIFGFLNQNDYVRECFSLSGKKLKEAVIFAKESKLDKAKEALVRYESQLDKCTRISNETLSIYLNTEFLKEEILGQLFRQRIVLENELNNPEVLEQRVKASGTLNEYLATLGFSSKYEVKKQDINKRIIVFNYSVIKEGDYNIKINKPDQELIKSPPKIIQIDNQSVEFSPSEVSAASIEYLPYRFSKGFHEIYLETDIGKNLIEESIAIEKLNPDLGFKYESDPQSKEQAFLGEATDKPISLTFNLHNLSIEQPYEISFDLDFYQGDRPVITITQDTDPLDSLGNIKPVIKHELGITTYPVQLQGIKFNYSPSLNASDAKLSFNLLPPKTPSLFTGSTKALIKNIRVRKAVNYNLELEEIRAATAQKLGEATIKWNKVNPTLYELELSNQKTPFILVFSETFHPLWKVLDSSGKTIELPHFSINGFANAWLVEKALPQKVYIKFILQDMESKGVLISAVSALLLISFVVYSNYKKPNA